MGWDDALDVWGCHGVVALSARFSPVSLRLRASAVSRLHGRKHTTIYSQSRGTAISAVYAFVVTFRGAQRHESRDERQSPAQGRGGEFGSRCMERRRMHSKNGELENVE